MVLLNFRTLNASDYIKKGYVCNGSFCTSYLYAVHVEAALERLKGTVYCSPEFKNLLHKLKKANVIWPEVGWTCEGFVGEAIHGLNFQGEQIEVFKLEALKGEPAVIRPDQWKPHQARYMLPGKYPFKYADGVLAWVNEQRVLHILALQVTVSPETHGKTEYKCVTQEEIQHWYTGHCMVHCVYICPAPTKRRAVSHSAEEGKVAYTTHELELSQCFTNLEQDEIDILKKLGNLRKVEAERRKKERLMYQGGYQIYSSIRMLHGIDHKH
ncbi:hypothetical protein SELMODRAFT_412431 [Selaginella moellendorffii]|uniref:Uncharacterized protein n=1 Tax=Selaginella moellendorffii TaxID=88036 RepID=D8RLH0_SELML|nr:hypothetical protein SELMODRAFT_412431 [Selaginella moellendorffii]